MAIVEFKDKRYSAYAYDTERRVVLSTKRSTIPTALTWLGSSKRVTLYSAGLYSRPQTISRDTIEKFYLNYGNVVKPTKPTNAVVIKPDPVLKNVSVVQEDPVWKCSDYIFFNRKTKKSRYFKKGTSIKKAIQMFDTTSVEDISVLIVDSGDIKGIFASVSGSDFVIEGA